MEFWTAEQLRKDFDAIGSFYKIKIKGELFTCRNHALIFRKGFENQKQPDAVVIMANPGSCSPIDSAYNPPIIEGDFLNAPYVPVRTDPTQHQLMRLMKLKNWNVISICNLSDLCAGNMGDFSEKLSHVKKCSIKNHSLFSNDRVAERKSLFQITQVNIILAWGKDPSIKELAINALEKVPNEPQIYGLRYQNSNWAYRHPNPMIKYKCIEWLEEMHLQLENLDFQSGIAATKE